MRTTKVLSIFIFGLIVLSVRIGEADPMGTAFTYQGRLMDENQPANGIYDLECKLFGSSDPCAAQVGPTLSFENGEVLDGYFTVHIDFGIGIFDGDERWLEILIRPGDSNDVSDFIALSPRQEITPTPYAMQTRGIFVDDSGNVGIGTKFPNKKLTVALGDFVVYPGHEASIITDGFNVKLGDPEGARNQVFLEIDDLTEKFVFNNGNVGIGTKSPLNDLHVYDSAGHAYVVAESESGYAFYIADGSNNSGLAIKENGTTRANVYWNTANDCLSLAEGSVDRLVVKGGKVGIGTTNPMGKLDVRSTNSTSLFVETLSSSVNAWFNASSGQAIMATSNSNTTPTVQISNSGNAGALSVNGTAKIDVLQIMGADVAEKFPVRNEDEIKPGMVVAIDPDHPGELCLSRTAYNQCVAGVISGANNLPAGAILGNLPGHEDGLPVALSGRVWVYCDAEKQPIEPGNLLTTAERSGYAMAVSNFEKANGAVIGKAMTRLEKGKIGLVLVLVNLQ